MVTIRFTKRCHEHALRGQLADVHPDVADRLIAQTRAELVTDVAGGEAAMLEGADEERADRPGIPGVLGHPTRGADDERILR